MSLIVLSGCHLIARSRWLRVEHSVRYSGGSRDPMDNVLDRDIAGYGPYERCDSKMHGGGDFQSDISFETIDAQMEGSDRFVRRYVSLSAPRKRRIFFITSREVVEASGILHDSRNTAVEIKLKPRGEECSVVSKRGRGRVYAVNKGDGDDRRGVEVTTATRASVNNI